MKKVLFWDFDGTLVYANERFIVTFSQVLKSYNYDISTEEIRAMFKAIYPWNNTEISYPDKKGEPWWEIFFGRMEAFYTEHNIPLGDKEKINQSFKTKMINDNTYVLYEDAKQVLKECMELGYHNYILSNNYPELPLIVEDFGLSEFFVEYFVSANIGYEKPRPELYEYALKKAGMPEIGYMIGDNPIADIKGGKAAGLKTILVHRDVSSEADFECKSLSEIPDLLIK